MTGVPLPSQHNLGVRKNIILTSKQYQYQRLYERGDKEGAVNEINKVKRPDCEKPYIPS